MSVIGIYACLQVVDLVSGLRTIGFEIDHVRLVEFHCRATRGTGRQGQGHDSYQSTHAVPNFV